MEQEQGTLVLYRQADEEGELVSARRLRRAFSVLLVCYCRWPHATCSQPQRDATTQPRRDATTQPRRDATTQPPPTPHPSRQRDTTSQPQRDTTTQPGRDTTAQS